jgi:hypothetical protein
MCEKMRVKVNIVFKTKGTFTSGKTVSKGEYPLRLAYREERRSRVVCTTVHCTLHEYLRVFGGKKLYH